MQKITIWNNNLKFVVDVLRYDKPSDLYSFFKTLVETSLKKQNSHYNIYYYDSKHVNIYGPYLLNLVNELPDEYLDIYDTKVLEEESDSYILWIALFK